jgi:hypothetical protein
MSKPRPIESFGRDLMAALLEGAKRPVHLQLPYKKAVHFTQRVNFMRREMERQKHPEYPAASQAKLTISWPEGTEVQRSSRGVASPVNKQVECTVTIAPADSEFGDAIRKAGVQVKDLSSDPLAETPAEGKVNESPDPFDDILASYVKG